MPTGVYPRPSALDWIAERSVYVDRGYATPCRITTYSLASHGYAMVSVDGSPRLVHRVAWEAERGPIPEGFEIDHLCRQRDCSNVAHLELVTRRENILRGDGPRLTRERAAAQTRCKRGHDLTDPANVYVLRGRRTCRLCAAERARKRRST